MKIAVILGTRPEIIKLSPVIRELTKRETDFFLIHTNQHYSASMDQVFFDELSLPQPQYNLEIHDLPQGAMVGQMLIALEPILLLEKPEWVLVQGDTNTVLAGALCAAKLGIRVGHVEAGLRSYDRTMPEELNRLLTDHLSSALFCPTPESAAIAKGEGIAPAQILVTGNTIVDAVEQNLALASHSSISGKYVGQQYSLLTMHRPGNVDDEETLTRLISSLAALAGSLRHPIFFPIHPRTDSALTRFGITPDPHQIVVMEPVGYLEMLLLMQSAQLIITDSGGVQEEACILRVPCLTIRDNTERPETVQVGANLVVGTTREKILSGATRQLARPRDWPNPFGNGDSAKKILDFVGVTS